VVGRKSGKGSVREVGRIRLMSTRKEAKGVTAAKGLKFHPQIQWKVPEKRKGGRKKKGRK